MSSGNSLSLILLPTLRCNAACEYCFENRTSKVMSPAEFRLALSKVVDYLIEEGIPDLTIWWQGGEVLTMNPDWFEQALEIQESVSHGTGTTIANKVQSNLIGYSTKWDSILHKMFGGEVGTSLDFPNLYRKVAGGTPNRFNELWYRKFQEASANNISVGVICVPNNETLKVGAEQLYSYFIEEIGLPGFQLNTPFPGGPLNMPREELILDSRKLSRFYSELLEVWLERGYRDGVGISPLVEFLNYFLGGPGGDWACVWGENCARNFVCIDPEGNISQCDCWVTSYPEFRFGNIFDTKSFSEILGSEPRRKISERPMQIIQNEDCIDCDFLTICHGGCPIRAFSTYGDLGRKDPYCESYKNLFLHTKRAADQLTQAFSLNK